MAERGRHQMAEWARRERTGDLTWIAENLHVFWPAARKGYEDLGQGAIVIDTTSRPTGAGTPMAYFPESEIGKLNDEDASRMVKAYDPGWEFVAMLLKQLGRVSARRAGVPSAKETNSSKA